MKSHLARWLRRYLPSEILSLVAAVAAAQAAYSFSGNPAVAALAGAWSETVTYYATMLLRESRSYPLATALRNLLLEFGLAEALDTLLIRPSLMYLATQFVSDVRLGVIVGKLAADVVFYVPAITAYELRRRYLPV